MTQFKDVLSAFPSGVTAVTARTPDGEYRGLALSAFCSVSATPPLILVCVDVGSTTCKAIRAAGWFTVNVLAANHEELALRLASKEPQKFSDVRTRRPDHPLAGPILEEVSAAYLVCRLEREVLAGDHFVFIAEPVEAWSDGSGPAMLYHRRAFSAAGIA